MPAGLLGERGTVSPASNCTITSPEAHAGELDQHRAFWTMMAPQTPGEQAQARTARRMRTPRNGPVTLLDEQDAAAAAE
jgi:hypothetical protein